MTAGPDSRTWRKFLRFIVRGLILLVILTAAAIRKLPDEDLAVLRAWFGEFDTAAWDRQFERDAAEGRLDALPTKPCETGTRGVAPTCERSRDTAILALLW